MNNYDMEIEISVFLRSFKKYDDYYKNKVG